jgi:hypothetical protein
MQKRTSLGGGSVSYHHVRSRPEAETGRAAAVRVENARCYTYTRGNEPVVLWQLAIEKPMSIWTAGESHYSVVIINFDGFRQAIQNNFIFNGHTKVIESKFIFSGIFLPSKILYYFGQLTPPAKIKVIFDIFYCVPSKFLMPFRKSLNNLAPHCSSPLSLPVSYTRKSPDLTL